MTDAEVELVAEAIYDAVDTISGDTIATVISMSSHLFETIDDGETEVEAVLRATMSVCRDAARAAIAALDKARWGGWRTMDSAPRNQRVLILSPSGEIYAAHWVQHPATGHDAWMISQAGADQHLIAAPTHWHPAPAPPPEGG